MGRTVTMATVSKAILREVHMSPWEQKDSAHEDRQESIWTFVSLTRSSQGPTAGLSRFYVISSFPQVAGS